MKVTFEHQKKESPKYYLAKGEIYVLKYNSYRSNQIGYGEGYLFNEEYYSNIEAAEQRISYLLAHNRNFSSLPLTDKNVEDWGITYIATKNDVFAKFVIKFVKAYDNPMNF